MKIFNLVIFLLLSIFLKAQTPQLNIPASTLGIVKNNQLCSDGNTLYYIQYSSTNYSTNIASLYKITGSSTTPVFVKELFKSDTALIQEVAVDTKYEYKINTMQCVNGVFYLLYYVKPSGGFFVTGWRLLTSDGTAAGTQISILSNDVTNRTFPNYVLKANDGVYTFNFTYLNGPPFTYTANWYKSMGTPATSGLVFSTPANESFDGYTRFNIAVKDNYVYFSNTKYTGTTATHTRYYRTNGTTTQLIKEVPFYLGAQFCVGQNDMLITFQSTMFNTSLNMTFQAAGYKIISLTDFSELATYNPPNSASPQSNSTWQFAYDNFVTNINGTYYIQGYQNFNRGFYLLKADNTISFWQMPLNAGAPNTAGFGDFELKRTDNRVYFTQFYSAHNYSGTASGTTGYNPTNARTSSMYYVTGGNPILVDSLNALEGRFFNDMDYCGDVLYGETRYNSIYNFSGGTPMQQRKAWRTDGTTVGSGYYSNLYDCTSLGGFYLGDVYPNGFIKHDGQLYFLGRTGCTFAEQGNALYKITQCSDALALFKNATATTTSSNANYTEGSRVFPYATNKPDSAIVAVYPNGLSLGTINATVYNEPSNIVTGGYTFLRRHFVINPTTDPAGNKKVRLYFSNADFAALQVADPSITNINQLQVVKYDGPTEDGTFDASDATSLITIPPTSITTGTEYGVNYLEFEVIGFSEFWISKASSIVPLTLLSFKAQLQADNSVLLKWETENEIRVKKYYLELSTDGRSFIPIADVNANNTQNKNSYSHKDGTLWVGNVRYYRLRKVDIDGKFTYSQIVKIDLSKDVTLSVYPNPASDYFTVNANQSIKNINVFNASGSLSKQFTIGNQNKFDIKELAKGLYLLKIELTNGNIINSKIVKQ